MFEPPPLLCGVGEFGKAVGDFNAADIKLKAFGDARILRRRFRQRRLAGRVFVKNRGAADAEFWFDLLGEYAAENVAPTIVVGNADAGHARGASKRLAVALPVSICERRQQIDAGVAAERFGDRYALRFSERVRRAAAKREVAGARRLRRLLQQRRTVVHQRRVGLAGPVPFEHRELRRMQRAPLAVAEHAGEFDDAALAGGQQLLAGKLGRGAKIKWRLRPVRRLKRRSKGVQVGFIAGRHLERPGLDLDEIVGGKPGAQCGGDAGARQQRRPAVGMHMRGPKRRRSRYPIRHYLVLGRVFGRLRK